MAVRSASGGESQVMRRSTDDLEAFVHKLDASALASVLLELAREHDTMNQKGASISAVHIQSV